MWKIMQENFEDLTSSNLWRSVAAELLGTIFVVLLGCGAYVSSVAPNVVQVALTFGLVFGTMVWCIGHISGGHLNPAVTLGALIVRRVSIVRGVLYMIFQCLGGMVGAGILYGLAPNESRRDVGVNVLAQNVTPAQGFGVELMITFVLVFTYLASYDTKRTDIRGSAPLTIGLAVVAAHLFAIPYTGCGMNSARSFGPAVVSGIWDNHWVYWVGPMTGALVAALVYEYVFAAGATFSRTSRCMLRSRKADITTEKQVEEGTELEKVEVVEIDKCEPEEDEDDKQKLTQPNGTDQ